MHLLLDGWVYLGWPVALCPEYLLLMHALSHQTVPAAAAVVPTAAAAAEPAAVHTVVTILKRKSA
jgi:hypothetical protein